jgi:hypothetical protein
MRPYAGATRRAKPVGLSLLGVLLAVMSLLVLIDLRSLFIQSEYPS